MRKLIRLAGKSDLPPLKKPEINSDELNGFVCPTCFESFITVDELSAHFPQHEGHQEKDKSTTLSVNDRPKDRLNILEGIISNIKGKLIDYCKDGFHNLSTDVADQSLEGFLSAILESSKEDKQRIINLEREKSVQIAEISCQNQKLTDLTDNLHKLKSNVASIRDEHANLRLQSRSNMDWTTREIKYISVKVPLVVKLTTNIAAKYKAKEDRQRYLSLGRLSKVGMLMRELKDDYYQLIELRNSLNDQFRLLSFNVATLKESLTNINRFNLLLADRLAAQRQLYNHQLASVLLNVQNVVKKDFFVLKYSVTEKFSMLRSEITDLNGSHSPKRIIDPLVIRLNSCVAHHATLKHEIGELKKHNTALVESSSSDEVSKVAIDYLKTEQVMLQEKFHLDLDISEAKHVQIVESLNGEISELLENRKNLAENVSYLENQIEEISTQNGFLLSDNQRLSRNLTIQRSTSTKLRDSLEQINSPLKDLIIFLQSLKDFMTVVSRGVLYQKSVFYMISGHMTRLYKDMENLKTTTFNKTNIIDTKIQKTFASILNYGHLRTKSQLMWRRSILLEFYSNFKTQISDYSSLKNLIREEINSIFELLFGAKTALKCFIDKNYSLTISLIRNERNEHTRILNTTRKDFLDKLVDLKSQLNKLYPSNTINSLIARIMCQFNKFSSVVPRVLVLHSDYVTKVESIRSTNVKLMERFVDSLKNGLALSNGEIHLCSQQFGRLIPIFTNVFRDNFSSLENLNFLVSVLNRRVVCFESSVSRKCSVFSESVVSVWNYQNNIISDLKQKIEYQKARMMTNKKLFDTFCSSVTATFKRDCLRDDLSDVQLVLAGLRWSFDGQIRGIEGNMNIFTESTMTFYRRMSTEMAAKNTRFEEITKKFNDLKDMHMIEVQKLTETLEQLTRSNKISINSLEYCNKQINKLNLENEELGKEVKTHQESIDLLMKQYIKMEERENDYKSQLSAIRIRNVDLTTAIRELASENSSLQIIANRVSNLQWNPDKESEECAKCHTSFTVSVRKHHCRNCGSIFCKACSSNMLILPFSPKKQRVCDQCNDNITNRRNPTHERFF